MTERLTGRRVVVTRPLAQAGELVGRLRGEGAEVVELPLTVIVPIAASDAIDTAIDRIATYDVIVVTSANGADCVAARMAERGATIDPGTTVVAVGAGTAEVLGRNAIRVDRIPARATGAAIVAELAAGGLAGVRILLPRARAGRPELVTGLRAAGAVVDDVAFYDTVRCQVDPDAVAAAQSADDVVLTAPSGVDAYIAAIGAAGSRPRIVTIGPTTSAAVRQAGLAVAAEATEQSVDGLIAAVRSLPPTHR